MGTVLCDIGPALAHQQLSPKRANYTEATHMAKKPLKKAKKLEETKPLTIARG
jgi:hypothetical protein